MSSPESQMSLLKSVVLMPLRGTFLLFCFPLLLLFPFLVLFSVHLFYVSVVFYFIILFLFFLSLDSHSVGNSTLRKRTIAPPGAIVRITLLRSAKPTEEVNDCTSWSDRLQNSSP